MYRLFLIPAWIGSNTPFEHTLPNGETALVYQTLLQAYNAADAGDIIQPAPPGTPGFCFYDANGEPLKTVTVNLGAIWTPSKTIALRGDWCRLRLDGMGMYLIQNAWFNVVSDVDFVRLYSQWSHGISFSKSAVFKRCFFAGLLAPYQNKSAIYSQRAQTFEDCAVFGNACRSNEVSASVTLMRCTMKLESWWGAVTDCVNAAGSDAEMSQPPAYATYDNDSTSATYGKFVYADGSEWTNNDWEKVDPRLLPTSPYATGATSVTSGQTVYDLAGNRRKPGGALGAYEVLSDVTHYERPGALWYKIDYESDDAPRITDVDRFGGVGNAGSARVLIARGTAAKLHREGRQIGGTDWSGQTTSASATWNFTATQGIESRFCALDANDEKISGYTYITVQTTPFEGAEPVDSFKRFEWFNVDGTQYAAAAPDASSVCYVDSSKSFRSTGAQVGKTYVGGWARPKFGNADVGELVLGLNAEATIAGKATIKNFSGTSDAAFDGLVAVSPAKITFKECAISDSASE